MEGERDGKKEMGWEEGDVVGGRAQKDVFKNKALW